MTEQEIVAGCKEGSRIHQEAFYKMFYSTVYKVCIRYEKDDARAKDLLQDCFMVMFTSIKKFKGAGSLEGWVRRITVNSYIDRFRSDARNPEDAHDFNGGTEEDNYGNASTTTFGNSGGESYIHTKATDGFRVEPEEFDILDIDGIHSDELLGILHSLTPKFRAVFNLYVMEGWSHKEIAERMGINEGTSKSNFYKAKRNLKKRLLEKKHLIVDYV